MELDSPEQQQQQQQQPQRTQAIPVQITPTPSTDSTPLRNAPAQGSSAHSGMRLYNEMQTHGMGGYDDDDLEYMPSYGGNDDIVQRLGPGELDESNKLVDEDFFNDFGNNWASVPSQASVAN
ncbi:hypothetical protein GGF43_006195 [Coemansia sp. RSA 2618]|nr:hypothetical protein GGF43_006195 [Coemansia sp. RSA 2618]